MVYMNGGDDWVITPSINVAHQFRGGYGNDYFPGDTAYGHWRNDTLSGYSGNDIFDGNENREREH